MNQTQIKEMQVKLGVPADGFFGPRSIAACEAHLRKLMPDPHPFPRQRDVSEFYGPHGVKGGYTPPMAVVNSPSLSTSKIIPWNRSAFMEACWFARSRLSASLRDLPHARRAKRSGGQYFRRCV